MKVRRAQCNIAIDIVVSDKQHNGRIGLIKEGW